MADPGGAVPAAAAAAAVCRRPVPNDHACLFTALAYLASPRDGAAGKAAATELREHVASAIAADPDRWCEPVLGKPNAQYQGWIRDPFSWGGYIEIVILAAKFSVAVAVVNMEEEPPNVQTVEPDGELRGRVLLCYTGQHYDPVVGVVAGADAADTAAELRVLPLQPAEEVGRVDRLVVALAAEWKAQRAADASRRKVKRIKCGGCGALCDDTDAFQEHCTTVDHDDDFDYMCEEVEVVEEGDAAVPEGRVDLSDAKAVHAVYNVHTEKLSNFHASPVVLRGKEYPTVEHWWQAAKFLDGDAALAERIRTAATIDDAHRLGTAYNPSAMRGDWDAARAEVLAEGLRAKFTAHPALRDALLGTAEKLIVLIDSDPWAGMQASDGIAAGRNGVGRALMHVRAELRAGAAPG